MTSTANRTLLGIGGALLFAWGVAEAQTTVRMEAEAMARDTYRIEALDFASNGALINLKGDGIVGTATAITRVEHIPRKTIRPLGVPRVIRREWRNDGIIDSLKSTKSTFWATPANRIPMLVKKRGPKKNNRASMGAAVRVK